MSLRLVRLFTRPDGQSHFEIGTVAMSAAGASLMSARENAAYVMFEETPAGSSLDWHNAPHRQYVVTLSGTLQFETRSGANATVAPGDILLAEDTTGGGHRWRLIDDAPWRRVYIGLPDIAGGR